MHMHSEQLRPVEAETVRSKLGRHSARSCLCGNTGAQRRLQTPMFLEDVINPLINEREGSGITCPISDDTKKVR
jgi:hypothetical protein